MPDVGAWGAAITAGGAAIAAIVAAARQPADVATLRTDVKTAREEVSPAVQKALDALSAALAESVSKVRADLSGVAKRVVALEEWRRHAREERSDTGRTVMTSGPDLLAAADREHERRITALEGRADKADARVERVEGSLSDARVSLGNVLGQLAAYMRGKG